MLQLSEDQLESHNDIVSYIHSPDGEFRLLSGYAGTGKTTTLGQIIESALYGSPFHTSVEALNSSSEDPFIDSLRSKETPEEMLPIGNSSLTIIATAPTHKAVKVMSKSYTGKIAKRVEFSTIHKLLRVKQKRDLTTGLVTYETDLYDGSDNPIEKYDVIIVDESSMLDESLFSTLLSKIDRTRQAIVFVGDSAQIPPVGYIHSPVFNEEVQAREGIKVFSLETVHRQAAGNPIIALATHIREQLKQPIRESGLTPYYTSAEGVGIERLKIDKEAGDILTKMFKSEEFKANADHAKVIAWTNRMVDKYNNIIRSAILGYKTDLVIGEKLLLDSPYDTKDIKLSTNTEFTVIDIEENFFEVESGIIGEEESTYAIYQILVELEIDNKLQRVKIPILQSKAYKQFNKNLKTIRDYVYKVDAPERKTVWKEFFKLQDTFAQVKYNYAITAHKSQGSTYENVAVIIDDILANPDVFERNRILYVATTRASKMLYIF